MSFNCNEGLSERQIALKQIYVTEILKDYHKHGAGSQPIFSKLPCHSPIDGFIDLVKNIIDIDQEHADQRILLLDDHSKDNIFQDPDNPERELSGVVLYSMERRCPGTMSGGNSWFDKSRREIKPRTREVITNIPELPGQSKVISSQWFDNSVKFKICARTNKRANELCDWFEQLMENNRYYFTVNGITKIFMDERERDSHEQIGNEQVECRPFFFFVRTERTYELTEQALNRIIVSLVS